MDFRARDFDGNGLDPVKVDDPVKTVLDIREELAEFRRNSGRQALLAKLRASREKDLLISMQGPDPFGLDFVIEHLRDRGLIPQAPPRWLGKTAAIPRRRRRRRRRDAENG